MCKRPSHKIYPGFWEFPGGKIEANETPESALIRELEEEIGIKAQSPDLIPSVFISHTYDTFHCLAVVYVLRNWQGTPEGKENQECAWFKAEEAFEKNLLPANYDMLHRLVEMFPEMALGRITPSPKECCG